MNLPRLVLLLSASAAALAACSDTRTLLREKYTGERIGDPVEGPRRPPKLNPGYAAAPAAQPGIAPLRQQAQKPASASPYDQYDAQGNEVGGTNYIKQWTSGSTSTSKSIGTQERKSFKGLTVSSSMEVPAPVTLKTQPVAPIAPVAVVHEPVPQIAPPPVIHDESGDNEVVVPQAPQSNAAPAKPSNLSASVQQIAQLQPAAGGNAEPHLSSVPQVPERFKEMKKEAPAAQKELEDEHKKAMDDKEKLSEEPTDLKPVTLPQVEGMLREIKDAINGDQPIVQAAR